MIAILLANLAPLVGVVFFGWDAFAVVVLYWFENVVIGVLNIVKMICCCPPASGDGGATTADPRQPGPLKALGDEIGGAAPVWAGHAVKLFFVPFFAVHYGLFTFVHGVFVFSLFGGMAGGAAGPFNAQNVRRVADEGLLWAALALGASHVAVLAQDYFWNGGFRRTNPMILMVEPYPRVIVLHVAIIFGAMLAFALGSPAWLLAILIAGKTALDIALYKRLRGAHAAEGDPPATLGDPRVLHEAPADPPR